MCRLLFHVRRRWGWTNLHLLTHKTLGKRRYRRPTHLGTGREICHVVPLPPGVGGGAGGAPRGDIGPGPFAIGGGGGGNDPVIKEDFL